MIVFGLLAAFFGWQSAQPLWLAFGGGAVGTATVTRCDAADATVAVDGGTTMYRCVSFVAAGDAFTVVDVTLLGVDDDTLADGDGVPARMISRDSDRAYAGPLGGLHLRWSTGLALVVLCGAGIAWTSGATRLADARHRRRATLLSFAGPLLLAAGFIAAAPL